MGPYTTVNNHSNESVLFLICKETKKSLIQESTISNLESFKPIRMPPDDPMELL